ncbi:MAG: hypothetical protein Fur0043_26980 [Anaerolineales bacterium]
MLPEEHPTPIIHREAGEKPPRDWRTWLFGPPLRTADAPHQTIGKFIGLAVFASDALSSTAYASQEILFILTVAGSGANGDGGQQQSSSSGGVADLPLQTVALESLTDGTPIAMDCSQYSGLILQMENGGQVTFFCPAPPEVTFSELSQDDPALPGALPQGATFLSAFSTAMLSGGAPQTLTDGRVLISFAIPAGVAVENLAILYWDGTGWVDLAEATFMDGKIVYQSGREQPAGFFTADVNFAGIFFLVTK